VDREPAEQLCAMVCCYIARDCRLDGILHLLDICQKEDTPQAIANASGAARFFSDFYSTKGFTEARELFMYGKKSKIAH